MQISQNLSLRDWQQEAYKIWVNSNYRGIFSVVTGGGKTFFAIYCLSKLFEGNNIDQAVIIVPTKTLQDQWASNILSITDLNEKDISFSYKKLRRITILVNLSAQKLDQSIDFTRSALILDECHRYGTASNESFLKLRFKSKTGLTATLERKYDDGVEKYLSPNIGSVIYNYDIKKGLSDGVVENYQMIYLKTQFTGEETLEYQDLTKKISKAYARSYKSDEKGSNYLDILLFRRTRLVNDSMQRKYVAAKIILENPKRKKIVFCESINQAEDIKSICKENGLDTAIYHSKMSRKDRISSLFQFQQDYFHTLIGCKALDEGFDVPDIDFGIIVSQTKTNRQRIQRLGRTIRKGIDKQKPIIYTLYTTNEEERMLREEKFNYPYIETKWLEIG